MVDDDLQELTAKARLVLAGIVESLQKLARRDREISAKLAKCGFVPGGALWKFANEYDAMALALEGLGAEMADNARKIKAIQENDAKLFRKWANRPMLNKGTGNEILQ